MVSIPAVIRRHADTVAVLVLLALTGIAAWDLLLGETIVGADAATQFYPPYSSLGESLRSDGIPAWNPHQFSGTPFAADPHSGWAYLPAMLLFAFLPLVAAAKSYMLFHLLLAGLSTYALARALGMGIPGALLAAIAYEYSGFLYVQNTCCFSYIGVMSWLPLAILGAELAIGSSRRLERVLWWGLSGLALSQILASWLGQGSYYALLALGGYIAYRTLLFPPAGIRGIWARFVGLALHGSAILAFGFGLAAAVVLPGLEYNTLSNLAGGYPAQAGTQAMQWGGWSVEDWVLLLEPGLWYAGVTVLALALIAPVVAKERFAVPYFAALSLYTLILSGQGPTLLHLVLYYLLPYFERIHPHTPDRVIMIFYLGVALLAGAALTALGERSDRKPLLLALLGSVAFLLMSMAILLPPRPGGWETLYSILFNGILIPVGSLLFLISAITLVGVYVLLPNRFPAWRGLAFALLVLVVFTDLLTADKTAIAGQKYATGGSMKGDRIREMDLATYYQPSGAARFLQSQQEPFRYFGYDPRSEVHIETSSPTQFTEPRVRALEVNNRAMLLGLQSIQGYNPMRIARYDEYMNALNGSKQDYHYTDVYEGGLNSPLLDLLNVRYVIIPADTTSEEPLGLQQLERTHPTVYEDDQTKVLENQDALPRTWIVHSAQQVKSKEEALDLLSSGQLNPKETALLEEEPPEMSQPDDSSTDRASVSEYEPNRIQLESSTGAPGLLVLSEVYYPAWKAYVDGRPAPIYITDHLLRSVPVPAGEHTIELRYESWTLRIGIVISLVTSAVLVAVVLATGARRWWQGGGGSKLTIA